jgi:fibronectin type 3 domain-containing protein
MRAATVWVLALACLSCGAPRFEALRERLRPRPQSAPIVVLPDTEVDLPAPRGVRARSDVLREVPVVWEPMLTGDIGGYQVERSPDDVEDWQAIGTATGRFSTTFVDLGEDLRGSLDDESEQLADGVRYRYRVRSIDSKGRLAREPSLVVSATTAALPDPPHGLRAYSHLPRQVALTWDPTLDPTVAGYIVLRSPSARGPFESIARVEDHFQPRYLDLGLGDLRVFYYRVSAYNVAGAVGAPTEPVVAVTKAEPLPPTGLRVVEKRLGENELRWEPNVEPKIAGYRLRRRRADQASPQTVAVLEPNQTAALDAGVGAGEVVSYSLVAFDTDGLESAATDPVQVESESYHLRAAVREAAVELRWSPNASERYASARVYRQGRMRRREIAEVRGSEYLDSEVEPGSAYRYVVVLVRSDGQEAPASRPVEVEVPDGAASAQSR